MVRVQPVWIGAGLEPNCSDLIALIVEFVRFSSSPLIIPRGLSNQTNAPVTICGALFNGELLNGNEMKLNGEGLPKGCEKIGKREDCVKSAGDFGLWR